MPRALSPAAAARILGARGGATRTPARASASRVNGARGGRPAGVYRDPLGLEIEIGDYVHAVADGWLVAAREAGAWRSPTGRGGYVQGWTLKQIAPAVHVYSHRGAAVRAAMRAYGLARD